ncbi:MAG: ROK family protein [Planctomycetes bacterium]|nr:ROK family protein [Planctomycetota bacterium]
MEPIYASIDLGGTNIKGVLGDGRGQVVRAASIPTEGHEGPEQVLARIADLVESLAGDAGARPSALGMGCPGLVDIARGATLFLPNVPGHWREIPVRDILAPRLGCPVYLLNDVRMATLGELTFGRGRRARTLVFFALGTGIGGGVAIDGKLRLGPLGAAGELGHQIIIPDGPRCGCGNRGCLEALASGPAIAAEGVRLMRIGLAPHLRERTGGDASQVTTKTMAEAAQAGDDAVRDAIVRAAEYLGIGVANTIVTLHPDLVVLGGGVAQIGNLVFDAVRRTVRERVRMLPVDGIQIEPSLLGDRAGALGGIALAMGGTALLGG